ncbi:hypothetical protein Pyn_39131 [Prunus yedoensis var. nudiflora]|uniref:Uncharacterized protein n=1 Tax=Prunus yedoensis var. nudiflora TaxID=2094558 RepID=A0A314Z9B0_PRUYE|nr:hypothetical protein Pyn_39131 [Prunus yedoensis var. nudiflora]
MMTQLRAKEKHIETHNLFFLGKVKQIVGSTLLDSKESGSALVDLSRAAAIEALHAYAGGSMVAFLFL